MGIDNVSWLPQNHALDIRKLVVRKGDETARVNNVQRNESRENRLREMSLKTTKEPQI
jgi:hypothetical protein